jgi:hypothetical protein
VSDRSTSGGWRKNNCLNACAFPSVSSASVPSDFLMAGVKAGVLEPRFLVHLASARSPFSSFVSATRLLWIERWAFLIALLLHLLAAWYLTKSSSVVLSQFRCRCVCFTLSIASRHSSSNPGIDLGTIFVSGYTSSAAVWNTAVTCTITLSKSPCEATIPISGSSGTRVLRKSSISVFL